MLAVNAVQMFTFAIAASICLCGAIGVVAFRNPVHNALSLVATLFGVAVLFVAQEAYFLAAIQVIVYAGAIVVLFLFVIMLLGVDTVKSFAVERRPVTLAVGGIAGATIAGLVLLAALPNKGTLTGETNSLGAVGALDPKHDVNVLGKVLFSNYVFAFEITSILLTIAVIGAVVLSRRPKGALIDLDEFPPVVSDPADAESDPSSTDSGSDSEESAKESQTSAGSAEAMAGSESAESAEH